MLALLPPALMYVMAFVFGAVVGSFLNVVIYRFHTGRSLGGHSHCLSCGKPLRWYELVPLFSYLVLRARCAGCGSFIPPRYFLVECLTGGLFALTVLTFLPNVFLILHGWILLALLVVILVYDYNHLIIPDRLVLLVGVVAVLLEGYRWLVVGDLWVPLVDVAAALLAGGFFFALWFISHGRWLGFGDVKLVLPLALIVGAPAVFSFVVSSFWIGALVSLTILAASALLRRGQSHLRIGGGRLTIKSEVPFGPFLVAGFAVTYLGGLDVLTLMFHVLS